MLIDVSQWQGSINWPAVKGSGVTRAFVKASEGIGWADPDFHSNWAEMASAGIPRGAYHFARPDGGNDPIVEADSFLSIVGSLGADDLVALDYEVQGGGGAWVLAWLQHVQTRTGKAPLFYSNYSGVSRVASGGAALAAFPLWLAYPGSPGNPPACPAPWSSIALWQYGTGNIPGINTNVDEDEPLALYGPASGSLGGFLLGLSDQEQADLYQKVVFLFNDVIAGTQDNPNGEASRLAFLFNDLINGTEDNAKGVTATVHRIEAALGAIAQAASDAKAAAVAAQTAAQNAATAAANAQASADNANNNAAAAAQVAGTIMTKLDNAGKAL